MNIFRSSHLDSQESFQSKREVPNEYKHLTGFVTAGIKVVLIVRFRLPSLLFCVVGDCFCHCFFFFFLLGA